MGSRGDFIPMIVKVGEIRWIHRMGMVMDPGDDKTFGDSKAI